MNIVILLKYKNDENEYEDMFINGDYITCSDKNHIYNEFIINDLDEPIVEQINLDSYLSKEEQEKFKKIKNYKILYPEQEAILNGEIDYAFDMIKNRLKDKDIELLLYNISKEAERYQDMTQEVLNYIIEHQETKETKDIFNIIKKWAC